MLKTRGGNRFEGYGNVKVATERGNRAGWQLTCWECNKLSDVIHRTGSGFPPKILIRIFSDRGWKVGNTPEMDVCPACLEKRRQRHREERKQYAKGNVDRLLDMIRQVDLMLASNVTIDYGPYQPQIAAQLKSLFETSYLCGMLALEDVASILPKPAPDVSNVDTLPIEDVGNTPTLPAVVPGSKPPMPLSEWQQGPHIDSMPQQQPSSEPPSPEPPPPPSPAPEVERISPRTAAFLAEVRKQIFKGAAA